MREVWKDIKGYEGLYQVSNLGRVRKKNKIIGYSNVRGYLQTGLTKEHTRKRYYIHRLVAEAFIQNQNNFPEVNHIDGNKQNNKVTNLSWCTHKENSEHRTKTLKKGFIKKVKQYTLQGEFIKLWDSIIEVEKTLGINNSNISECCSGKRKTAGGYIWRGLS